MDFYRSHALQLRRLPLTSWRRSCMLVAAILVIDLAIPSITQARSGGSLLTDAVIFQQLQWRSIGPKRGGRSLAVAGHKDRRNEYYFGATGGGLWKTTDGGTTWDPVTDGQIGSSSVGAVAVAESSPDVVYVGMGETQLRQNVLQGDGIYRSDDGGKSWVHLGLDKTRAISRIRIHPEDPDRVYVAALGNPFGASPERGIFRTLDGGRTWQKILYRNEKTGAIDLVLDPNNPDVMYASLWQVYRKPFILWSGGEGSGVFKSKDGGETWKELTSNSGLPQGVLGKITITVSGADSNRVYANFEAEEGGLYRSDDGGETWALVNSHRDLWQRAFYFLRIQADPIDRDTVYVLNFKLLKSTDGGRTFEYLPESHSDHHDLWIDPVNPLRMVNGNDGGGVVSVNGGRTWTHMRYATAQIYRLAVTNDFPYHACGAQQDNSTACVPSDYGRHFHNPRAEPAEWLYAVGGSENGYVVQHPLRTNIFYSGATNALHRYDRDTGLVTDVQPHPRIVMGEPAKAMPERWNWNYPIAISPVDPDLLLVGSQHVWQTSDEGRIWEKISPDLTSADPRTMRDSGGPITLDQDGPEIYATLYAITPSRHDANTIWTGSDDGMVHLTRNGGRTWLNVTPTDLPKDSKVTAIESSPHGPGTAYLTARRYEMNDRAPYVWKTKDYGTSWSRIVTGIGTDDFGHSICEDPERKGLLYLGTEHGVYVSFDDGAGWQSLSHNLPDVPVMGVAVKENDLVIATHGRSFYVLDGIHLLRQVDSNTASAEVHLFRPADAVRRIRPATLDLYLKESSGITVDILDSGGQVVRTLSHDEVTESGMHRLSWDLRYEGATVFRGIILEGGDPTKGPWAPPGRYQARLVAGGEERIQTFAVKKDPRLKDVTDEGLHAQFDLALRIRNDESAANEAVLLSRRLTTQVGDRLGRSGDARLRATAHDLLTSIDAVAGKLYQLKNQSPKDKIAFPIKLNDRLTGLRSVVERGDGAPTKAMYRVYGELSAELDDHLNELNEVLEAAIPQFNKELKRLGLDKITPNSQDMADRAWPEKP